MDSALTLKRGLSVEDAAAHFQKILKSPFTARDVYKLIFEGILPVYYYLNRQSAQQVVYEPKDYFLIDQGFDKSPYETGDEVIGEEKPFGNFATFRAVMDTPVQTETSKPAFLFRLSGDRVLPLEGFARLEVEKSPMIKAWMFSLCTGVASPVVSFDGLIVSDGDGQHWQLLDRIDGAYQPYTRLPEPSQLWIGGDDIEAVLLELKATKPKFETETMRTEKTYRNIIGVLLELLLKTPDAPRPAFKSQEAIIDFIEEKFSHLKNLSKRNLQKYFAQASDAVKDQSENK